MFVLQNRSILLKIHIFYKENLTSNISCCIFFLIVRVREMTSNKYLKENSNMLEKMKEIIAEQLSVDASEIELSSNFKEDLGADSLDLFELVMALEEEYDVEIPAEELENIATVEDVIEYLKAHGVEA